MKTAPLQPEPRPQITALAPWFGAKRNLAGTIVEELGRHRVFWDLFCGSMAILMAKEPCAMETVNDLHGDLVNMARVIQDGTLGPQLYRRLRRTLMCEQLHREAAERHRSRGYMGDGPPDLDAACDYFLCAWVGRNGVAGTQSYNMGFCVRYTANGGHAAKRWSSAVDSIPAWRRRLRNATILCRDAFELLPKIDDAAGTAIYVDPPYLSETRNTGGGRAHSSAKYVHDFKDGDHERLARELRRFRLARVVVSYYDDPRLPDLYPGWTIRRIEVSKAMAMSGRRGANDRRVVECVILNGPSFGAPETGSLF